MIAWETAPVGKRRFELSPRRVQYRVGMDDGPRPARQHQGQPPAKPDGRDRGNQQGYKTFPLFRWIRRFSRPEMPEEQKRNRTLEKLVIGNVIYNLIEQLAVSGVAIDHAQNVLVHHLNPSNFATEL